MPTSLHFASRTIRQPEQYIGEERRRLRLSAGLDGRPELFVDRLGLTSGSYFAGHWQTVLPYWMPIAIAWTATGLLLIAGRRFSTKGTGPAGAFE